MCFVNYCITSEGGIKGGGQRGVKGIYDCKKCPRGEHKGVREEGMKKVKGVFHNGYYFVHECITV